RVEKVDTTWAVLEYSRFRNIVVQGNNFNGITSAMHNPVTVSHQQNTAATTWAVDGSAALPFGGWARHVQAVVAEGSITTPAPGATTRFDMPYVQLEQGPERKLINLRWPVAVLGRVQVTLRVDAPV